jgi:hypothetical protein
MVSFKKKPDNPAQDFFEEFGVKTPPKSEIDTTVFDSPDGRFESARKIGKRKIDVICPECGKLITVEVAKYDMKTGQKTFAEENG